MTAPFALTARNRRTIDRLLAATSVLLPAAVVVYALVARSGDWVAQRHFIVYTAPLLALGPAWLRRRLAAIGERPGATAWLDLVAFAASAARGVGAGLVLPWSGHTLFLTYVLLAGPGRAFRVIAAILLATATWFKLAFWKDPYTWGLGIAIGVVLAAARRHADRRHHVG